MVVVVPWIRNSHRQFSLIKIFLNISQLTTGKCWSPAARGSIFNGPHQPGVGREEEEVDGAAVLLRLDDKSLQFLSPFEEPLKKKFNFQVSCSKHLRC